MPVEPDHRHQRRQHAAVPRPARRPGNPSTRRTRAIRDLLSQAPPIVVASLLGYHPARAELLAAEASATWKRYAAGDHARRG